MLLKTCLPFTSAHLVLPLNALGGAPSVLALATAFMLMGAHIARAHGPVDDRIRNLTVEIARNSDNPAALIERAELYRQTGELSNALADYERALRLDPASAVVHLGRGLALFELGDLAGALAAVDASISREANCASAWRLRARTLSSLHRGADAVAALDRVIDLASPPLPDDYLLRAQLLASLDRSLLDDAIAGLDAGLTRLGPAVTLQLFAVELERRRGSYDAALARLDEIQEHCERVETILVLRGDVLVQAGLGEEADAVYTDALQAIEERFARGRATPAGLQLKADVLRKLCRDGGE